MYSEMRLQLYQSHSFTAIGLESEKVHKLGLCGHYRDFKVTLKLKLHTINVVKINITHQNYIYYSLRVVRLTVFKSQCKICERY